jgi:hypothetical protein
MADAPRVVGLDGACAVLVPDWHSYHSMLGNYCGKEKMDGSLKRGADLYVLCHDADRAQEVLDRLLKTPFLVAQEIAIARRHVYGPVVDALLSAGHAVACDSFGPPCDDARLKALHPPPEGPTVDFEWDPSRKVVRIRCLSMRKDGETSSERVVLRDDSFDARLKAAYSRFAKRRPMNADTGLVCLPHVAAALSRIDATAAARLRSWLAAMREAGVDGHQDVPALLVPAASVSDPGELLSMELSGTAGSYLVSSVCRYAGGTTIRDRTLDLHAEMPDTMQVGLVGMSLDRIWGDPDLAGLTVRSRIRKGQGIGYGLDARTCAIPTPRPPAPDQDAAAVALADGSLGRLSIEEAVLALMRPMAPATRLHVYRTLLCQDDVTLDVSPWIEGASRRINVGQRDRYVRLCGSQYASTDDGISL